MTVVAARAVLAESNQTCTKNETYRKFFCMMVSYAVRSQQPYSRTARLDRNPRSGRSSEPFSDPFLARIAASH